MRDDQLLRYSRHILLDEWGVEGQEKVSASHALIVGAGGLGSPAALYLASAGVGHLTLVDHDHVDVTNLQRQIAHTEARVGQLKVESLKNAIGQINPEVKVTALGQKAEALLLTSLVPTVDLVLDCTDNFETRHAINLACVTHAKPLVSGSALRFDGQLAVYDTRHATAPCYACVFPPQQKFEEVRCATMGVLPSGWRHRQSTSQRNSQIVKRHAPGNTGSTADVQRFAHRVAKYSNSSPGQLSCLQQLATRQ